MIYHIYIYIYILGCRILRLFLERGRCLRQHYEVSSMQCFIKSFFVFLGTLWHMKHVLICCPTDTCQYISQELVSAGFQKQVCRMAGGLSTPFEKSKDCSCWFIEITSAAVQVRVVGIASFWRIFPQDHGLSISNLYNSQTFPTSF